MLRLANQILGLIIGIVTGTCCFPSETGPVVGTCYFSWAPGTAGFSWKTGTSDHQFYTRRLYASSHSFPTEPLLGYKLNEVMSTWSNIIKESNENFHWYILTVFSSPSLKLCWLFHWHTKPHWQSSAGTYREVFIQVCSKIFQNDWVCLNYFNFFNTCQMMT